MGANGSSDSGGASRSSDAVLRREGSKFSPEEGQALKALFTKIAGRSENEQAITETDLQSYFEQSSTRLPRPLVTGLFHALLGNNCQQYSHQDNPLLSFLYFVKHVSYILKGSVVERAQFLHLLCAGDSPELSKASLTVAITEIAKTACVSKCSETSFPHLTDFSFSEESAERLAATLLNTLSESDIISQSDFENWLYKSEIAIQIFVQGCSSILFQDNPGVIQTSSTEPQIMLPVKTRHPLLRESFSSQLFDHSSLTLLNTYLPDEYRSRMYPLFSSAHHGESYSMLCKQLIEAHGPTLVVVKDSDGYVFGGFAAEKWQCGPKFKGNANCFLFTLSPKMDVFTASGYNENYMYLEQNAQTLPNGLGMGGQMDYFGLWLSADYGHGHSKARPKCSTFNSPRLSKQEEFRVELLEVWGVGEPTLPEEVDAAPSILDKDKTASTLMELAGRKMYSKDIRETPEEK